MVINGWGSNVGEAGSRTSRLTDCDSPARAIYLADNEDGPWRTIMTRASDRDVTRCGVFQPSHLSTSKTQGIGDGQRVARARHHGGANCLYLDWHVDWVDASEMTEERWYFER